MADQTFNVNAGFFTSVNDDREYYAEDMNRPYSRVITNGVFATPQGTPSTDLQAVANSGMQILVKKGQGLFADKWFENPSDLAITVPNNTGATARLDLVLVQIDTRLSGRCGNIVYRTGSSAQPSYNTVSGVVEYPVARIMVSAGATAITQSAIYDMRGTAACPWVTSLIKQVDTSTLFAQWQSAFQEYYQTATTEFESYMDETEEDFDTFLSGLTSQLTAATNVISLRSSYTTVGLTSYAPVGISGYNPSTDVLLVFINGILASPDMYTYSNGNINLTNTLNEGQVISFVCFKSVIAGNISSLSSLIQNLNATITAATQDTGWNTITVSNGEVQVRKIGPHVYIRGYINEPPIDTTLFTLPPSLRPTYTHEWTSSCVNGSSCLPVMLYVGTNGNVKIGATYAGISGAVALDTTFAV